MQSKQVTSADWSSHSTQKVKGADDEEEEDVAVVVGGGGGAGAGIGLA